MSSSDYTKLKKTGVLLNNLTNEPYVLDDSKYTDFMNYNLENTITNSKIVYNNLILPNHQIIFNMDRTVTNCPAFILCNQTQSRENRKNINDFQIAPKPKSKYIKDRMLFSKAYKTLCKEKGVTQTNCQLCACITTHYYSITVTYNNPVESFIVFTGFFVTENIQGKNVITNFYLESDRTNILLTTGDTRSADNIYPDINPPHHFPSNGVTISYFGMGPSVINLRTEGGSDMLSVLSDGDWIDVIDIDTFFTFNITELPKLP